MAAERDHQPPVGAIYHRNRYKHVQVLPVSPDCVVIVRNTSGDPSLPSMVAIRPDEITTTLGLEPSPSGIGWFWMVVGDGRVTLLVQQYYN